MGLIRALTGLGLVLLLQACTEPLATLGPTPPGEGITIYIHASFIGASQALNVDVSNLEKVEGPCTNQGEGEAPTWSDCISSIRVEQGWKATLYRDRDFKGESVTITESALDLREMRGPCDGSFNDCVSSIRVTRD
jgi:hypothetical protein